MKAFINAVLKYPSAWIVWLFNQPIIKRWVENPFVKKYITVKAINALCLIGAIVLIAIDFPLASDPIPGNTWSELMRAYGQSQLVLPWLCGVLIGHLFHVQDDLLPANGLLNQIQAYNLIFWLTAILIIFGAVAFYFRWNINAWVMTLTAGLGCAVGHYLWPMTREAGKWKW